MFKSEFLRMVLKIVQKDRSELRTIASLMFLSSIIDFLGLSLIAPFMLFFINFENEYLIIFGQNFDREQALALLGSSILLAYSIKCFVAIFLQKNNKLFQ